MKTVNMPIDGPNRPPEVFYRLEDDISVGTPIQFVGIDGTTYRRKVVKVERTKDEDGETLVKLWVR